jgi:hypothetical protein
VRPALIRHPLPLLALFLAMSFSLGAPAHAQEVPVPTHEQGAPAASWAATAAVGMQLQSGTTDQTAISITGRASRQTQTWNYFLQEESIYALVKIGGTSQTVADSDDVRLFASRDLTKHSYLLLTPSYNRNEVQGIRYYFDQLAGYGARVVQNPRIYLHIVAVAGAKEDDKSVPGANGLKATSGFYALGGGTLTYLSDNAGKCQPQVTWGETFLYIRDLQALPDYRMTSKARLTFPLSDWASGEINYSISRENLVRAQDRPVVQELTFNFGVKLKSSSPQSSAPAPPNPAGRRCTPSH